jgi:hypothetical protein
MDHHFSQINFTNWSFCSAKVYNSLQGDQETHLRLFMEDTGFGGLRGGSILKAQQKNDFGTIPHFLVTANDRKAHLVSEKTKVPPKVINGRVLDRQ